MNRLPSLLIVDDEADACRNLSDIFTDLGYQVDTANDGLEALERMRSARYDLAVLDLMMPGMDGIALYREMKQRSPETVAVLATAYPNHPRVDHGMKAGLWKILSKPVDLSQLVTLLDEAVKQPLVLVVDDDRELCASLCDLLRDEGYRVAVAHDLRSATTRLQDNGFGVVLVDLRLPDGDGRELLQTVRRLESHARTILITGHRPDTSGEQLSGIPPDAVCYKPFDVRELLGLIEGFRPAQGPG
ncbi:MAG: response regulator [Planctomycetia bacterium]|nr:response regulator [Planctomycetia bacterium]